MKILSIRLDDDLANEIERLTQAKGIASQSELVRLALRALVARERLESRRAALAEYVQDQAAMREMADIAEAGIEDMDALRRRVEKG